MGQKVSTPESARLTVIVVLTLFHHFPFNIDEYFCWFDVVDLQTSGDGTVSFNEYEMIMQHVMTAVRRHHSSGSGSGRSRPGEEHVRTAFMVFDIDGNGLIDARELRETLQSFGEALSEEDIESMIRLVDKNGDGQIDYEGM